jgi:hypothetical protein
MEHLRSKESKQSTKGKHAELTLLAVAVAGVIPKLKACIVSAMAYNCSIRLLGVS